MRAAILVLLVTSRAASATPEAAATLFASGQELYANGDYAAAAEKFELAFAEDPDPVYQFNRGQAYRSAKDCAKALVAYRRFLELAPQAPNRGDVEQLVEEMEACAPKPAKPPPEEEPQPIVMTSGSFSTPGIAIGIGGVALLGLGVWFGLDARSAADDRETLCLARDGCRWTVATTREANELDDRGKRSSVIAITSFAVGGAALATGIILNILSKRSHRQSPIAIGVTGSGVSVRGELTF